MPHTLDFIIFGVPRSGTKGLVHALNLHPQVYCAEERFHFRADHSAITFPDSFLEPSSFASHDSGLKLDQIRAALAQKVNVHHAGNKLPRYYFALDRINKEIPDLNNIWIYRSPYGFMPSWNRREEDRRGQWPRGQIGLFGVLELFVCIDSCLSLSKETFVFPYKHGLTSSPAVVLSTLDFIGADSSAYPGRAFDKKQRLQIRKRGRQKHDASKRLPLQDYEEELLDTLRIKELDAILEQDRGVLVSEIAVPLKDYLDRIGPALPGAFDRAFKTCDNRAAPAFGRDYFKRNQAALSGLLERTEGSEVFAGFQRADIYERLKSLYVQGSALKRRLASIRISKST